MKKELVLHNGMVAYIDAQDWDFVSQWDWKALKIRDRWYVGRMEAKRVLLLHRVLMGVTIPSIKVDHENNDGLDNCRINLRVCSSAQNSKNRRAWKKGSSKYLGVSWNKKRGKWSAIITINYKNITLGFFIEEIEAAIAYDLAAIRFHGVWANPNFKRLKTCLY